ncbi:MAG: phytanoyl-CoA dioxygenase family protein [Planctomycetales bacterium]|nr:phytanoyl-CoA dioxygenase family protein [Planctomycetales bacterium]
MPTRSNSLEMQPGDALFFHSNLLHRRDQNHSPHDCWALICGGNGRSNEPYKEGEPPRYTPLAKVSTATTSGTRAAGGWAPGAGQTRCDRSTRDRGARSSRSCLHRRYGRRAGLFTRAFPTRCRRNVELLAPSLECSPA